MLDSLYHTIFKVNKKNAIALTEEFNFNEEEFFDIYRTFRPIVDVQIFTDTEIRGLLRDLKNEFVNENKVFDLKIFKRNNIELLEYDLKEYLICFERGRYEVWDKVKGTYFYHLKLESENKTPYHQTLLISDKNEIQIEIYFKQILIAIDEFIENESQASKNGVLKTQSKDNKAEYTDLVDMEAISEFHFINNFDQVNEKKVYEYFYKNLVETKYISDKELEKYIILAFQKNEKPNSRFALLNKPTNKKIQKIFYEYFKDIAGKPYGEKNKYVTLLGDYFMGFSTDSLVTNFSKTY